MALRRRLAAEFSASHPGEAAASLRGFSAPEVARVFEFLGAEVAAMVAARMAPGMLRRVVETLDTEEGAELLRHLPVEVAATALRGIPGEHRDGILAELEPKLAAEFSRIVESAPGTAGALMDPRAFAISADTTVAEVLKQLRREGQHLLYNVYVVDRDGRLAGVFNLQELLLASGSQRIATIAKPAHHRLAVTADRRAILEHEGWRSVYSLPVVDDGDRYVGAVRYQTLRRLELESSDLETVDTTASALGDLFRAGIGGLIEALATGVPHENERPEGASS